MGARISPDTISLAKDTGRFLQGFGGLVYMAADDGLARYVAEETQAILFSPAVHVIEHEELYRLRNPFASGVVCTGLSADGYLRPLLGSTRLVLVLGEYREVFSTISGMLPAGVRLAVVTNDSAEEVRKTAEELLLGNTLPISAAPTLTLLWKMVTNTTSL